MIQRLYVNNFRCLENFELSFSGKPSSLLIGRNGSGKSTVGLALEVLQKIGRGTNRVGSLVRPTEFSRGRAAGIIRFEIDVRLGGVDYRYALALELPEGFRELRVAEEKLLFGGKELYSRDGAQVTLSKTSTDKEAKFLVDWHLVALPVIQEQSELDPLHVFKSWLARMLILGPIPSLITGDSEGDSLMPNRQVTNFGEWWTGLLAHSPAAYTHIDRYLKGVMSDIDDIKNQKTGQDFRSLSVQFQQDTATLSLPFRDLSDGEKCFCICAVVIASNQAYGPVFCYWDEPDNYLSISEVGHFVMTLRRSFEAGGQLVITSHNPEAIDKFSNDNTLLLHRQGHLEPTRVRSISEIQVNGNLVDALIRNDVEP